MRVRRVSNLNMTETARLALGLRALGLSDTEVVNFLLWIETGGEQYRPKAPGEPGDSAH